MRHAKHPWFARPASEHPKLGPPPQEGKDVPQGPKPAITKKLAKGGKMIAPHR